MKLGQKKEKQLSLPNFDRPPVDKRFFVSLAQGLVRGFAIYGGLEFVSIGLALSLLPPTMEQTSRGFYLSMAGVVPLVPAMLLWINIEDRIDRQAEKRSSRIAVFPKDK